MNLNRTTSACLNIIFSHPTQIQPVQQIPQQQQQPQQFTQQQQQAPQQPKLPQQSIVPSLPGPVAQPAVPSPAPALLPAQFALSSKQASQQRPFTRQGKSVKTTSQLADNLPSSSDNIIDCGAGNDLGFCAASEKYPR